MATRAPLGRVAPEAIRRREIDRLPPDTLERLRALGDLTATLSDALDALGLRGAVPASTLAPLDGGQRVVGQALTVRNAERPDGLVAAREGGRSRMGEIEAWNLAEPGDLVVIEGLAEVSNLGGQSATMAHRAGVAGVVVDGGIRDPATSRGLGLAVWSRGATPITGKWRLETVEINGTVRIAGVAVSAGDVVAADAAGIVVVPFAQVDAVLAQAEHIDAGDRRQQADIAGGRPLGEIAATRYK